jgi:hypothetical protein
LVVPFKHVFIFALQGCLDFCSGVNGFESNEEVKCAFRRAKLVLEGVVDELDSFFFNQVDVCTEFVKENLPFFLIRLFVYVLWEVLQ